MRCNVASDRSASAPPVCLRARAPLREYVSVRWCFVSRERMDLSVIFLTLPLLICGPPPLLCLSGWRVSPAVVSLSPAINTTRAHHQQPALPRLWCTGTASSVWCCAPTTQENPTDLGARIYSKQAYLGMPSALGGLRPFSAVWSN